MRTRALTPSSAPRLLAPGAIAPGALALGALVLGVLGLGAVALLGAGCFTPELGPAPFTCAPGGVCPARYVCHPDNVCRLEPPAVDGGLPDVATPDLALPDAGIDLPGLDVASDAPPIDLPADSGGVDLAGDPAADVAPADLPPDMPPPTGDPRDIVINEVHFAAATTGTNPTLRTEYVELYNRGDGAVDLGGWALGDNQIGSAPLAIFPQGVVLPARSFLVVFANGFDLKQLPASSGACYDHFVAGPGWMSGGALANSGDVVSLWRSSTTFDASTLVDFVAYSPNGSIGDAAWDDVAVAAGLWASDRAVIGDADPRTPIALRQDGVTGRETSDPAADWSQYPEGQSGTPCGPN